ncbi:hypothetical protein MY3957_003686 [Beauveria namnaoensis]
MLLDDGRVEIDCNSKLVRSLTAVYRGPARKSPESPAPEYSAASPQQRTEWATKLNIVIQVVGSRGDVQPFVALGTELQRHGHRVRLATHNIFDKFVRDAGLEFYPVGGNPADLMAYMVKNPSLIPSMGSLVAGEVQKKRHMVEEMLDGFWDSCLQDDPVTGKPFVADAIIANPPSFAHVHCAQALGIPVHLMFTMPWSNTRSFPHPLANLKNVNGDVGIANYLSYDVVEWMTWQGLGDIVNKWRRSIDLEDVAMFDGPMLTKSLNIPFTYCWSPALVPKPEDWPSHIDVCGFFFRDAPKFAPPADLVQFIEFGPAPIYIGFGSIVLDDPDKVLRTILDAVRATGVRAIISKGWSDMPGSDSPDIYWIADCPHEWLFQHVYAVVHHGGAGTTACGLRNGKPTIIVPFFGDQPFWGDMVARAGAGPKPIPHKEMTADILAQGIQYCLSDTAVAAAKLLASRMESEPVKEWRNDRRQRARDLENLESQNSSAGMHHGHSQDQKDQTSLDGRSSSDSNLAASTKLSKKQGSLAGRMAGASAKSIANFAPTALKGMLVDIPLAITEGLNSVPKMYGGTVRDNGQVTDAKSGAIVAGKTFARGFVDGFTDLVVEPYNGARKDGALGAVKGLGMGAVSLTTKSGAAAGSILHIVTTGVQLATTLQTHMELAREAEHELHDIVFDVNATAAALKQLHTIIDVDRDLSDRTVAVFKDDGVREIEMLALKCHAIYNNVTMLIQRASHSYSAEAGRDRSSSSSSGVPAAADEASLDPTTLRPLTLMGKLRWPWLRPRILRCREQLNWLKVSLLFTLQIANIAQWQMSGKRHAETSCEVEMRQQTARQLQKRRNSMLRGFAGIEADGGAQDGLQRPVTSSSGADESLLGAVFSTTKESIKEKSTTPISNMDGPGQRSTTYCTPMAAESSPADVDTHTTTSRCLMSEQGLPEIRDASVLPTFPNGRLDAFAITAAPTTFFAKRSAPATGEAVAQSGNLSRHPPAKPTANTRSSEPPVIVNQLPTYYLNHWADRVFGRQSKYRNDKQSSTLEAYIAENFGRDVPIKVPFGHERLMFGLDKVLKDWRGDQWSNYLAASPLTRLALDAISEAAQKASSHEKTCLAFKEYSSTQGLLTPFMLVFFSLEKAQDPVILSFNGRRYSVPFAACRTLHSVEERIREVCCSSSASSSLPTFIAENRYEFADQNDNIILPSFLIESIHPGMELSLLPRRVFIETPSEVDTRQICTMTREPLLHKPTSRLERRGRLDALEHREQVEAGENGEPFNAFLRLDVPKRERFPFSVRLRSAIRSLGRVPHEAENPATSQSHDLLPSLPMNYMGYAPPPPPPGPPLAPVPGPMAGFTPGILGPAETDNLYNSHEGDRTFASTPAMLIPGLEPRDEAPPCLPPPIQPAGDVSGPGTQSRHRTTSKYSDVLGVDDSEAQSLDDDLDLDVLDVGTEIIKGNMSIDKWLRQMTNVGCAGNKAIATAELPG